MLMCVLFSFLCNDDCRKNVPVVLIGIHNCSLESKIKMNLGILFVLIVLFFSDFIVSLFLFRYSDAHVVEQATEAKKLER